MDFSPYFEANKVLWNQRTLIHKDSAFYDVAGFKAGNTVLTPIELNELGDVAGKKMLHLQCHFGLDSLNWARLGAIVTGVDLSDEAIKEAKQLNATLGLNASFVCSNVYDLHPKRMAETGIFPLGKDAAGVFDVVFTTYGVISWLPDLDAWAEIIAYYLKPGGLLYFAEFHPVVWMFDEDFTHITYPYCKSQVIETESQGTYADRDAQIKVKEYGWNHSISEVLTALLSKGLRLESFTEYMSSPYPCLNNIVPAENGNWHIRGLEGKIPMVYSLKAVKAV